MAEFKPFSAAIHKRFADLSTRPLFVVQFPEVGPEDPHPIWDAYLKAFPEGTNPLFKTRTEHDCSCCRNFVKNLGGVVSIVGGKVETVWQVEGLESPYREVAEALHNYVKDLHISGAFRSSEPSYGAATTKQLLGSGAVHTWNHFFGKVGPLHYTEDVGPKRAEFDAAVQVFSRGLIEITPMAIATVTRLIQDNAIYRGSEHKQAVLEFANLYGQFHLLEYPRQKELFIFENALKSHSRIRNTAIGTLLQDLSSGMAEEAAVKAFEAKVAPANYKRPTALITPAMVNSAMETIRALDLEEALQRRVATLADVSINDVLWADNSVHAKMKDGVEALLMGEASKAPVDTKRAIPITMDEFLKTVLPKARSMDVILRGSQTQNFMAVTAPSNPDPKKLFKWNNDFAWSYTGNVADSMAEKVKAAGGDVNAKLRISLGWHNADDLDLHVRTPNGSHIYHGARSGAGGALDVDMNAFGVQNKVDPVENVAFHAPQAGEYTVNVNQYSRRSSDNVGFDLQVVVDGTVSAFRHPKGLSSDKMCLKFRLDGQGQVTFPLVSNDLVVGQQSHASKWGVSTGVPVRVNTLMLSPNYWDGNATGNKHWFFLLEGCTPDEPARGIYNEFLNPQLETHRKVFEVLGNKTMCPVSVDGLYGVGLSSTRKDTLTVQVKGESMQGLYNITF